MMTALKIKYGSANIPPWVPEDLHEFWLRQRNCNPPPGITAKDCSWPNFLYRMVSACYTYYLGDEVAFYVELENSIEEYQNDDNTGGLLLDTSDMDENLLEVIINEDEPILGDGHIKEKHV